MAEPVRLLLVDDHRIVREGLASMLATQPDLRVVGEAGTGRAALELAARLCPDVMLLDLEMPEVDGVGVLEGVRAGALRVRVIVLTAYGTDQRILDAVRAGAKGYLLKGAGLDEVLRAIRVVAAGGSILEPGVTERLLSVVEPLLRGEAVQGALTERERAIVRGMARGLSNREIGQELSLAERTVKFYATVVFQKLDVANRAEAVAAALREHLI